MNDKAKWLAGLKEGDPVVVCSNYPKSRRLQKVASLTRTLIKTTGGQRFRNGNGYQPGHPRFYFSWIEEPTAAQTRKAGR